jgi:hypothetical protein
MSRHRRETTLMKPIGSPYPIPASSIQKSIAGDFQSISPPPSFAPKYPTHHDHPKWAGSHPPRPPPHPQKVRSHPPHAPFHTHLHQLTRPQQSHPNPPHQSISPQPSNPREKLLQNQNPAASAKTRNPPATNACYSAKATTRKKTARPRSTSTRAAWPVTASRYDTV